VLHAPPISIFSILSPARNWVRSTDHSAPHYVIFSIQNDGQNHSSLYSNL
jgi:hypothetical protein